MSRCLALACAVVAALAAVPATTSAAGTLEGRAVLPALTEDDGPASGAALGAGPINGVLLPFARQPVQGFSGILPAGDGSWWAMPDNGYGRKENSADWLLRVYRVRPDLRTAGSGDGGVTVEGFVSLRDPDRLFPYPLARDDRLLTGADVDPESIFAAPDGTWWIGDEFGPWMLHVGRDGRLLEAPVTLDGVRSPQDPALAPGDEPTLGRSKGFEAAAITPDGRRAIVFLEGPLLADPDQTRRWAYEFDVAGGRFTGRRWAYRAEDPAWLVADAKVVDGHRVAVIERDDAEGAQAVFKRVFEVDLDRTAPAGFAAKRPVADLMDLRDPDGVSLPAQPGDRGLGPGFAFSLRSVECLSLLPDGRLMIASDNNLPFDAGRHDGRPDGGEWIVVRPAPPEIALHAPSRRVHPRARARVRYELARDATVTLRVRRHGRTVRRVRVDAAAGAGTLRLRAPRRTGRYALRAIARLANAVAGDTAVLRVR